MNEPKVINETEVETCLELARQWDTEDMTHPPHRAPEEFKDLEAFKERANEPTLDFEPFAASLSVDKGGA